MIDVALPGDICISDLLPFLAELSGFSGQSPFDVGAETMAWSLYASDAAQPFAAEHTLSDYGIMDGEILHFQGTSSQ